jgi:hypothetical protein
MMEILDARILAHTTRAIHLYRHLLREAGYLPDRVARREMRNQIISRFRRNVGQHKQMLRGPRAHFDLLERNLRSAAKGLRKLRKANDGSIPSLFSCLKEAYCQSGHGRYKPLKSLLVADQGGEEQGEPNGIDRTLSNIFYRDKDTVEHRRFGPPEVLPGNKLRYSVSRQYGKLYAVVTSPRHEIALDMKKRIPYKLVIENATIGRKRVRNKLIGRSRVKNKLKRWYAEFLAKVPVPLPEAEWMELRDLALGNKPWDGHPKRRIRAGRKPFHLSKTELERFIYLEELEPSLPLATEILRAGVKTSRPLPKFRSHRATIPLFNLEGTWLERKELRQAVTQDILEEELQIVSPFVVKGTQKTSPHIITARFMRRLWARVFRGIPLLQKTADGKWSVTWGHDELLKAEPPRGLDDLFESLEGSSSGSKVRCQK